jgi:hypothetical protein
MRPSHGRILGGVPDAKKWARLLLTKYPSTTVLPSVRSGVHTRASSGFPLEAYGNHRLREAGNCRSKLRGSRSRFKPRADHYTKYPATIASFQVRRTEGTMPTKSFSAFQKLCAPAPKRVRAIFGAGFIFRNPGMITFSFFSADGRGCLWRFRTGTAARVLRLVP